VLLGLFRKETLVETVAVVQQVAVVAVVDTLPLALLTRQRTLGPQVVLV
jgi:hypothetical protein